MDIQGELNNMMDDDQDAQSKKNEDNIFKDSFIPKDLVDLPDKMLEKAFKNMEDNDDNNNNNKLEIFQGFEQTTHEKTIPKVTHSELTTVMLQ